MTARPARTRIATAYLVTTLLLTAGAAVVAASRGTAPAPRLATEAGAPWSRNTFVQFSIDGMFPVAPAAKAPPVLPVEQAPGPVKNLRRADRQ